MHPTTYQFLTAEHIRTLHREAEISRLGALAHRASKTKSHIPTNRMRIRFGIVGRLVARLAAV